MVAGFDNASSGVQVCDVLVGGGVLKEDASEVVAVELAPTMAWSLDADPRTNGFEV